MELSDEDVGLASQNTAPKKVELSDADVFGAPAQPVAELSDADVFGAPAPAQAAMVQPEAPGMLAGAGSAVVRGYQDNQVNSGIAEKFRLRGYKTSLERGGDFETDIGELIMSGKATPAQSELFRSGVPRTDPVWRAAEIARVTNEMGKLDQSIKNSAATIQNYSGKSQPYQDLQAANEAAKKEGRPIMGTLENLWNNPAGIPEFVAEGAYGTAKPIAGAIAAAIALRRGQAAPLAQKLAPIGVSMGITGIDSYKGQIAEMIEKKGREGGVDIRKNPEMMDDLLQDANFIEAVKTDALKAGINDAAWAGISTWLGMTPRIKGIWQPVVQSVAEGGTDISKQLIIDGKVSDPQSAIMSTVAGGVFEGPSYGIARAAGAFGKPAAPAGPQATPPPASPDPAAPAPAAAAPDTINADDLPSVAGETVAPVEAPTPAPAQPQAKAPAPAPVAQPAAVEPEPVAPVAEVAPAAERPAPTGNERLPRDLAGARPRFGYGNKNVELTFESDLDKAAYVTSQPSKNKRHDDYVAWAMKTFGMTEAELVAHGKDVRAAAKEAARTSTGDKATVKRVIEMPSPRPATKRQPAPAVQPAPAAVQPQPEPAPVQPPAAPAPAQKRKLFRGFGREDKGAVYTQGTAGPVLGNGKYYAFSETEARQYGPEVETRDFDPKNPLVIRNDSEWRALTKEAGWKYPNPFGRSAELTAAETKALNDLLRSKGHDAIVIEGINDSNSDETKTISQVFGSDQVYFPETAQPEAQPAAPAQTEIAGTEDTFNLTGEQVAPPTTRTEDTTAEMPLEGTQENPLATEARARLAKLEASGKGDSGQAQALRRTIERETQPEAPAPVAQPNPRTDAEISPTQSPQAEAPAAEAATAEPVDAGEKNPLTRTPQPPDVVPPEGYPQPDTKPTATQPKQVKAGPTISEAAKAKKSDQPQTKRARTALRNAIRQFGRDDKRTERKYRAVLDALEREAYREKSARDISQPYLGRKEPADVTAARQLLAKKAKATGGISGYDIAKANALIEQYEAEVDLSQGQLRDDGQIRLVSDDMLNRVIAHVQGMLDDGKKPDADAQNAFDLATEELTRRENESTEGYGDPIADVRGIARKDVGIPLLPAVRTERGETAFAGTEYSALAESLPPELSKEGGLFVEPDGGVDVERARKDGDYRNKLRIAAEGMMEKLSARLIELGWTQLEGDSMGVIQLLQNAAMGRPQIPEGGVGGANFKGDPNTVAKTHSGAIDLNTLGSEGQVNTEEEADTREPEPSDEDRQTALDMEVEYEDPRFDAQPDPFTETLLAEAEAQGVSEQSILEMLDKAAAEALDPNNANEFFTSIPRLAAALTWVTARQIQKGVVSFAKWSADTARKFPSLKGSLKAIWAKAQDIAKRPMDYIRFRALDSIADKVWQNASRNKGSATLRKIANIVFAKAGPDADASENDIPTRINLVRNQFSNIYANIMERFAAEFADMTQEQRRKWDEDFRAAVIDGTTPSDPKVAQAVKDFRNLMRDLLAYQRNAGIEMGDQGANYFPRNYDADAVEADRDGFIAAAQEMYRKREKRLLDKAIKDVRKAEKDRPAERRAADKKFGRKEKTDAEYQQEAAEWAQEKIAALEAEFDAKDDDFYKQKAEDWATAITHGDVLGMTLFKTSEGKVTSDSTDARTFTNEEAKLADDFLKKNIDDIMMGYIDGAVRGAEVGRIFGQDGSKFEQMMNQLSKEGVDAETVKETRRLVQKALGVGREQQSQATAAFFDWVNVVLAGAFLGKTFMYNLVLEPISFGIRTGNAYLALKSMADTWRLTLAELGTPSPATRQRIEAKYGSQAAFAKSVTETVAEQVGLIQNEMERAYFNAHWDYSSDEKGSKMAKWISQRIYRANLMSATEKAKVRASIGIARLALRDNARFFTGDAPIQKLFGALGFDTKADKSAAVIMRENGVPDADHKAFAAWVAGLEGKTDAEWQKAVMDPKDPMAKHYRRALQRMSLGMSIKTNPALKMEMSDSVLGRLMMQLMNYSYAYSNLVKDRMYSMAAQTVAKDASTIDRLRYAAPLLVGAPLAIMGAAASKALIAGLWPSDDEEKRSKETPMVRKAFNWASFAGMFGPKVEYLFKSFERGQAPGGPVGETIFRGGQAVFAAANDPDSEKKAYNAKKQLYNSTVKPLVTGAGAAVHPFFGFLGNAAVNNQDVRETVTGQAPRK